MNELIDAIEEENSKNKKIKKIKEILARKPRVDPNVQDDYGYTALTLAVRGGGPELVGLLLKAGADPNIQTQTPPGSAKWHIRENALLVAASIGDLETTKLLLNKGAKTNLQDKDKETALMWASRKGYKEIVKLLLKNDADPTIQDQNGETALSLACEHLQVNIVQLLLETKAEDLPNILNIEYDNSLLVIVKRNSASEERTEIIKLLLDAKPYPVKVDDSDLNNWTPLLWVSEHDNEEDIRLLIEAGANPKLKGTKKDYSESQSPHDNPMVAEIYKEYKKSKLLGAEQRLAISKDKGIDNDLLDKLLQSIKNPDINDPRNLKIIDRYKKQVGKKKRTKKKKDKKKKKQTKINSKN